MFKYFSEAQHIIIPLMTDLLIKIFEDADRSRKVCIIEDIERLLEFIDLEPRFSNDILQTLLILLKGLPKSLIASCK
jgi:hypothetical protein